MIRRIATGRFGTASEPSCSCPQIIPLVAAGITGAGCCPCPVSVNQVLTAIGLGDLTRAWLGDFDTALPAVGFIGVWVLLGLCTVLLLTGHDKIDPALYESARLDGAGWFQEFRSITLPSLRQEIGVCITVTVIAALAASTSCTSRPAADLAASTAVPGLQIYISPSPSGRSAWRRRWRWSCSSSSWHACFRSSGSARRTQ